MIISRKYRGPILLALIFAFMVTSPAMAGDHKGVTDQVSAPSSSAEKDPFSVKGSTWNGTLKSLTLRSLYAPNKQENESKGPTLPINLPIPLEIGGLSAADSDPGDQLGIVEKREDRYTSCTFGVKYTFSSFKLQDFGKSLKSLFKNDKKEKSKETQPVSFFVAFPQF